MFIDQLSPTPSPFFLYGTAWKEDKTEQLTQLALKAGFRGIDTANQRKHYYEQAVGEGLQKAYESLNLTRDSIWLQTKFTHIAGQDYRLPYDPKAPIYEQVMSSFESSLVHLYTNYLDSYVLHGPSLRNGLADEDWAAWEAMEELYKQGKVRALGVSNMTAAQLQLLLNDCEVNPLYVQNRCYASQGWDKAVRKICDQHGIVYQGFSLLTANREVWASSAIAQLSKLYQCSPAEIIFSFALAVKMLPLTGTSDPQHMKNDLQSRKDLLSEDHVKLIESIYK